MRRQAREVVYKTLYSELFNDEKSNLIDELIKEENLNESDTAFCKKLYETIDKNREEIDGIISELAKNYRLERIFSTDRCALYIGICEMKYFDDVPNIVAIDEALFLCRVYSTAESLAFVNGIFAEVKKRLENE